MSIIYDALRRVDKKPGQSQDRRIEIKKINIKKLILPLLIIIALAMVFSNWQATTSLRKISQPVIEDLEKTPLAKKKPLPKPYGALAQKPQALVVRDPFSNTAPSPFKLSGIIYSPDKPVAIVNGKTVSIGELIGEAKVSNIKEGSVELSFHDETIILTLE
jgi:hypothetical protein